MNWLTNTFGSSVGKKLMMAVTGLFFCVFLVLHLAGNLTLYMGKDAFNSYAEHLHSLGPLLTLAEWGLLTFAIIHISTGLFLFYQNYKARPTRYAVNKRAGGRTLGSATMPYTGVLLLLFVIYHLFNFHFVDKTHTTIFQIVSNAFAQPGYVLIYTFAMIIAAVHVSHGFWSAFQTLGANHPKYTPFLRGLSLVFSLIVGIGFGFIPVYVSLLV
ncbi:MAG: succinate dehydrogenase cytochrome b subunit [Desulfobacteraceae bacterium]|jgi:succinate dehydrogenase cytochrome b subunit|nr:succinate dehydrogenase cytochrome b subunit [Desulfobacteraceae bacterium]MDH3572399.1 succinate dehydrogenase cytochrome b subunit [Desulfobacteraceae bacterium]MDH3720693.1 succinate dehydrogenase cytochrome b subunit [Desulfobacteraceae bacterium]MDH3835390.1 succinate dehydrogenase cytochrome b subunit [Desulfobacteraceae bacterium]MDH3873340.1 succinate dehydrogenase cytochrome b subunit [Desulfobacteraceae bacterium]